MDQNQQLEYFQDKVKGSSTCKQASDSKGCVPALENVEFSEWARMLPNQKQVWHSKTKQLAVEFSSIWQLACIPSVTEAFVKVKILKLIKYYHNVLKNYMKTETCSYNHFCRSMNMIFDIAQKNLKWKWLIIQAGKKTQHFTTINAKCLRLAQWQVLRVILQNIMIIFDWLQYRDFNKCFCDWWNVC